MLRCQKGFTLVEMLVVITIIGILAALAIPNLTKARNKAKEAEVKANLHILQIALERFYTDQSQYPAYIAGGDQGGWYRYQKRMRDMSEDSAQYLIDPLIDKGYIDPSYPRNPFVNQAESINIVKLTGGNDEAGSGDPRFGAGGDLAANGLDDPRFMSDVTIGGSTTLLRDLPNGEQEPWDIDLLKLHWWNSRIGAAEDLRGQLRYNFGGNQILDINGEVRKVNDWWPGNFFYRAMGEIDPAQTVRSGGGSQNEFFIYEFRYHKFSTYMLGGYGAKDTIGQDVIRNIQIPGEEYYEKPREYFPDVFIALPEVYGGGDAQKHPVFPPKEINGNDWIYGAPDGIDDGVVTYLTGSGSSRTF